MMLLCFYQLLLSALYVILAFCHIGLDAVDLLALREDQCGKLIE
jgi:hypothetical protein